MYHIKSYKMKNLIITTATAITFVFIMGCSVNSKVTSTETVQNLN